MPPYIWELLYFDEDNYLLCYQIFANKIKKNIFRKKCELKSIGLKLNVD